MPEIHEQRSDGGASPQKPVVPNSSLPRASPLIPNSQQRKHWAKQYRTEIAASSSSILSTFAASSDTRRAAPRSSAEDSSRSRAQFDLGDTIVIGSPFELTKLSAQISVLMAKSSTSSTDDPVRSSYQQKGTLSTARNIIMHRGVMGLYSGFGFHLLRDTIGTAIYFTTYESGKQLLVKFQGSNSPTSPLSVATAGGLCGLVSWACIYPIDSAKTHYQRNCLTKAKGQPVKMPRIQFNKASMYRGLGVSMARSCAINTIFFSSFELIKKRINNLPDPVVS
ncbi:MAG: hypothetical protein Q9181_003015 [Wetmoreana brouardii]